MKHSSIYRKDSIVITAIEIISELGIHGLTSKEIAKREKISEGTLFSHFKNMNDIILAVLDYYTELDESIIETIETKNLPPLEALFFYASIYTESYDNHPEISCLVRIVDMFKHNELLDKRANEIAELKVSYLKSLFEKAQNSGSINPNIDSEILMDVIIGSFIFIIDKWRKNNYSFKLKDQVLTTLQIVVDAISHTK